MLGKAMAAYNKAPTKEERRKDVVVIIIYYNSSIMKGKKNSCLIYNKLWH